MAVHPRLTSIEFSSNDNASIRFTGTADNAPFLFGVYPMQIRQVAATGALLVVGIKGQETPEIFACASQEDAHRFAVSILDHVDGVYADL
jgi:hypothetical protein